ncbi:RNA recognition motif 2-domain-containing protein [Fusarium venenatum]|uniref:RNA recognition motif 2-domain-containing protein n=1 Tax=Fusarium venenatum TaxID=56646 RepID=UPI001D5E16E0|nr:RNA recognition motif 2-domain-containing protein [Fusarium venenatum]
MASRPGGPKTMSSPPDGVMESYQGTPDTRLTMFSPGENTVTYHHGGNYSTGAMAPHDVYEGTDRTQRIENDPFVDASNSGRLSATASSFKPTKGKSAAVLLPEGGLVIASALSHEMDISHRLELCDTPTPDIEEVQAFMEDLQSRGMTFFGARHVETDGSHVYVCFEDLRGIINFHDAVRKSEKTWLPSYVKVKQERLDRGDVRLGELRQLNVSIEMLDYAVADPIYVEEIVQRKLCNFGSLFALVRTNSFPNGGFRGVVQFCKAAKATWAFQNTRQIAAEGLMIFLIRPADAFPGMDGIIGGMDGLAVSGARHYPVNSMSLLAPRAPEGNPWAPIAYQFSGGPTYRPFCPPTPAATLIHSRGPSYNVGHSFVNYGSMVQRRGPRFGQRSQPQRNNNIVDIYDLMAGRDIMLRNIPNKVDQPLLKRIVDASSYGKYDFMYLRIDFANDCNVGYAFINFVKAEYIVDFVQARANKRWNCFRSDKVAEVSYATIQGKDCLVQKFRNSSVMLEAEHYRPKLFYTIHSEDPGMAGREEPFPGPDNQSKMKRSVENAEHVGLFTPTAGHHFREAQRHRHSQFDRGTRLAALEEANYEQSIVLSRHSRY